MVVLFIGFISITRGRGIDREAMPLPSTVFRSDRRDRGDINPADSEELFLPGLLASVWLGYGIPVSEDLTA
jgi:hypothetical protein